MKHVHHGLKLRLVSYAESKMLNDHVSPTQAATLALAWGAAYYGPIPKPVAEWLRQHMARREK